MKAISVKFPEATLRRLREEARATGRSVAALVRERVERLPDGGSRSVYEISADLTGSVAGDREPADQQAAQVCPIVIPSRPR